MRSLGTVLHLLRTRRYLMLSALTVLVAVGCVAAGTWQIHRYSYKHDANADLRGNEHAAVAPVGSLLKVTDAAGGNRTDASKTASPQFRRATATGTYLSGQQLLVRQRSVDGNIGYLVMTPLATSSDAHGPVLLVVRGFLAADQSSTPTVARAPTGTVTVTARVQPAENADDKFGTDPRGQISAVNAVSEAARLRRPVYDGYVELLDAQAGGKGLTPIPTPDLSNPAGGAVEPQHLAYIAQWYLFAALALAAPLVMARSESRRPDEPVDGDLSAFGPPPHDHIDADDPHADEGDTDEGDADEGEAQRRARLADRYGTARRI